MSFMFDRYYQLSYVPNILVLMQVMTAGQRATFEYHGNGYIFTVNQAVVEGQEKSKKIERGMITNETYIVFEAPHASGIKVQSLPRSPLYSFKYYVIFTFPLIFRKINFHVATCKLITIDFLFIRYSFIYIMVMELSLCVYTLSPSPPFLFPFIYFCLLK